jgi:lysophospholipase L1-like esterase
MPQLLRRAGRVALLVLWSLLASFLLGEALLRLVPSLNRSQVPLIRTMSLELHHGFKPSVGGVELEWGPRRVAYATNSLAMRDRNPRRVDLDDGRRRVLVLGDSFVEGIGVEYGDTFVARIEERLRAAGQEVEVLNGGVSSWAPILEYLRLRQLLALGLEPEKVLLFVDPSDPKDELDYVEDFATFDHTGEPVDMARRDPFRGETLLQTIWRRLETSSLVVWNLEQLIRSEGAPPPPRQHPTGYQPLPAPRGSDPDAARGSWARPGPDWELWGRRAVGYIRADLRRMKTLADRHRFPLVVVVYPHPLQLRNPWEAQFMSRTWAEAAAAEGLPLVDLTPVFAERADWRACFIPGDEHWNEQGHQVVAEAIFERVFAPR